MGYIIGTKQASVAQLVEHHVANVIVAGSNPVTRSIFFCRNGRGNTGLAPRRLQSRTSKSAPSPPRIAKPEFPTPIIGKKCRLFGLWRGGGWEYREYREWHLASCVSCALEFRHTWPSVLFVPISGISSYSAHTLYNMHSF